VSWRSAAAYDCSGEVNLENNVLPQDPLGARCALLLSHGCSLNMALDIDSVFLATTGPQTSRGLLEVGPDMAKVLAVVALRKARLNSKTLP
jgi:hypothetical protein